MGFALHHESFKKEQALEQRGKEKLRKLIDTNLVGVVIMDPDARILEANDAFLKLLGFDQIDLKSGLSWFEFASVPADRLQKVAADLNTKGYFPPFERKMTRKDGSRVPVLAGVSVLDQDDRQLVAFILDMTSQKHAELQKDLLVQTQDALQHRDELSSIASHELKTPLTAVQLQINLIRKLLTERNALVGREPEILTGCVESVARLVALVNALMDISRLRIGKLELRLIDLDLIASLRHVVRSFESGGLCADGQIELVTPASVMVRWDPVRLEQVLTNLLSIAIKYGEGKLIHVRISTRLHERDESLWAQIEVADSGPGVDPKLESQIFERYERGVLDSAEIEGMGLGLFVAREIARAHGGDIILSNRPGKGANFLFEAPCRQRAAA